MTTAVMLISINKCKYTQFLTSGTVQNRQCSPGIDPNIPKIMKQYFKLWYIKSFF